MGPRSRVDAVRWIWWWPVHKLLLIADDAAMSSVVEEAEALAGQGPGRVAVGDVTSLEFVSRLRAARGALDAAGRAAVEKMVAQARGALDGVERAGADPHPETWQKKWARRLTVAGRMGSKVEIERARHREMLSRVGGPAAVGIGPTVMTALEAAAIAATASLDSETAAVLAMPWQERQIQS